MWTNVAPRFHAFAWLLWLTAAMLAALGTRNPIYLLLITVVALLVNRNLEQADPLFSEEGSQSEIRNPQTAARRLLLGTVVGLTVTVALLKGISLHLGTTVLIRLPDEWPVIGGPITLEGMVSSSLDGLSLLTVLAVFAAFTTGADYYDILRSVPPFLHQVGLVTSIAITFVPKTIERFAEIREAQALRGHKVRRIGDLLPVIIPLLAGGMERSMNLAEAMEARGFSRSPTGSRRVRPIISQIGIATGVGLILIGGTFPMFAGTIAMIGWATVISGVVVIAVTLWAIGRRSQRGRYRRSIWRERDTMLSTLAIGTITFLLAYKIQAPSALAYYPFPSIVLPVFDPVIAAAFVGIAAPILILRIGTTRAHLGGTFFMMENNFDKYQTTTPISTLREEQVRLTQQRILNTFETELMNNGFANVSIRSVARNAGMSVPTVYRYYANKEALLVALMDASEAEVGFNPFGILASMHDPMEAITALLDGLWEQIEKRPGRTRAVLQAIAEANDGSEPVFEVLRRVAFMAREALSPLSHMPEDKVQELQALVALLLGPETWYSLRVGQGLTREQARAVVLDAIKATLEAAGAKAQRSGNGRQSQPERSEEALRERFREASKDFGAARPATND